MSSDTLFLVSQLFILLGAFGVGYWAGRGSVEEQEPPEPQRLRVIQGRTAVLYDYDKDGA